MAGQSAAAGGPTWRDLVDNTEALRKELTLKIEHAEENLGGKIDDVAVTLTEVKDSLLPRVAVLEETSERHGRTLAEYETRIGNLEGARNRAIGHIGAWKIGGGVLGCAGGIVIADLVAHALGL